MTGHICKRTGIRESESETAEIKCTICGFCEREAVREEFENPPRVRDTTDEDD
jgi:hypothetical protein